MKDATGKAFYLLFPDLQTRSNSLFHGIEFEPALVTEIPYHISEFCAADTPEGQESAILALSETITQLSNAANESKIDLSDDDRRQIHDGVRDTFISAIIFARETMSSNQISSLVVEHVDFLSYFNELSNRELEIRAKRLASLCAVAR